MVIRFFRRNTTEIDTLRLLLDGPRRASDLPESHLEALLRGAYVEEHNRTIHLTVKGQIQALSGGRSR